MLVGQERAESILSRALRQGRVSHAYLFVGPEGAGKNTAAVLFAQALNCERAPSSLAPCGTCPSCRRIAAGTHPDVRVIVPGSKGGQNISVEQMREVRQDVARRPIMGRRKLYLMPTAEAMNEEAANTLLKTLEEPPGYVTLVLMATSPTRVLPTILSRCQIVPFGLAPAASIQEWLTAQGVAHDTAVALALTAGGRPGLALRWSREPEALERRRQLLRLLEDVAPLRQRARQNPGEGIAALRLAERARALVGPDDGEGRAGDGATTKREEARGRGGEGARGGASAKRALGEGTAPEDLITPSPEPLTTEAAKPAAKPAFLRLLEVVRGYYRDLLLLAQGAPEALVWNADALVALRAAVGFYSSEELLAALAAVDRCQQFLERNVAPQLALETLFLELLQPGGVTATVGAGAR